jgi:hypothetical protein
MNSYFFFELVNHFDGCASLLQKELLFFFLAAVSTSGAIPSESAWTTVNWESFFKTSAESPRPGTATLKTANAQNAAAQRRNLMACFLRDKNEQRIDFSFPNRTPQTLASATWHRETAPSVFDET